MNDDQIEQLLEKTIAGLGASLGPMLDNQHPNAIPVAGVFVQAVQAREQLKMRAVLQGVAELGLERILS